MGNRIKRELGPGLGADEHGQLWAWDPKEPRTMQLVRTDPRNDTCPICGRGWELTGRSFVDQWTEQAMPDHSAPPPKAGYSGRLVPMHYTCVRGVERLVEARFWYGELVAHELNRQGVSIAEAPNRYGSAWNNPWYEACFGHMPSVRFIVGTRKRVYHIEAAGLTKEQCDAVEAALVDVEDTKYADEGKDGAWSYVVHAWNDPSARLLLRLIHRVLDVKRA